ncbi:MAG: serine hydrolase domain-containing protein [Chloroflexota bacterium]
MNHASPESVGISSEQLAHISPSMQQYVDSNRVAGIVTLAARRGQVVHLDSWGVQDLKTQAPMQTDSIFRIFSMTKPIVSVALMMMFEQGKFQLFDPISKYLPKFESVKVMNVDGSTEALAGPITFHHVLTHQSGLSYGFFQDSPVEKLYQEAKLFDPMRPLGTFIDMVAELPLCFQPGAGWRYSVATDVVGRLVELMADMPLADYLQEKILRPLNMTDTNYWTAQENAARLTTLYGDTIEHGRMTPMDVPPKTPHLHPNVGQRGGSGLLSTAQDYVKFAQMILNKGRYEGQRFLGPRTVDYMTQNHIPASHFPLTIGTPMMGLGFGLGFSVIMDTSANGVMGSIGNHGWSGMADTHFWVDSKEDLIGITCTQYIAEEITNIRHDFKNILYSAIMD